MTDHVDDAIKTARVLEGARLAWFHLGVAGVQALSALASAADSAARTYAANSRPPGAPGPSRRP